MYHVELMSWHTMSEFSDSRRGLGAGNLTAKRLEIELTSQTAEVNFRESEGEIAGNRKGADKERGRQNTWKRQPYLS